MYSQLTTDAIKEVEKRKLKAADKIKLLKQYSTGFKQFKELDFTKMKFTVKNYNKFEDLKK